MTGRLPSDGEIAYWYKIQCKKCKYRAELPSGSIADGTCNYIRVTGRARRCDMQNCERYEPGDRIRVKVDYDGKIHMAKGKIQKKVKPRKRPPSRCACGEWLDMMIAHMTVRQAADALETSNDHFSTFRMTPGAAMSKRMAEVASKRFGVSVEEIRKMEAGYDTERACPGD